MDDAYRAFREVPGTEQTLLRKFPLSTTIIACGVKKSYSGEGDHTAFMKKNVLLPRRPMRKDLTT